MKEKVFMTPMRLKEQGCQVQKIKGSKKPNWSKMKKGQMKAQFSLKKL